MPEPEPTTETFESFLEVLAPGKEPNLDIVAVHGLNPTSEPLHAKKTWTANGKMWLKDFLPDDLPNARIMLFGYNANVAFEPSTSGIHDQAEDLLGKLDLERLNIPDRNRPIIFIAHSLGGLVVKQALVRGNMGEDFKSIPEATCGIAFFATPHQGSDIGKLGEIAAIISKEVNQNSSDSLLESMKKDSLYSDDLANQFRHQLFNYYFLSFYERRRSKETGCLIVDKKSSILGIPGDKEKQIPMEADHTSICKFASADTHNYKVVRGRLIEMAKKAFQDLEKNKEDIQSKVPAYSSMVDSSGLLEACSRGDMDGVRSFVKSGADVNFQNAKAYTPLMIAVERDSFEMVGLLLSLNAKVEGSLLAEKSPLGIAIDNGSLGMVELLLDNKADPNANSVNLRVGRALPLGQAVHAGHEDIVRLLLDRDANASGVPQGALLGLTPLHLALHKSSKNENIVKFLLEYGAKIDKPSTNGETAVECIKGLRGSSKIAASKGLPLMPQLKEALSDNLFSEVASVLVSEIHWGLRFGEAGKRYGKDLVLKYPDGRLHPLNLPLNLGVGVQGVVWSPTRAYEMPVAVGQYQLPQQQPSLSSNSPMRSYRSPHSSRIQELSPQQRQPGTYPPTHTPYVAGSLPFRSYSSPNSAEIHKLSPQQHQAGAYQPANVLHAFGNQPMRSYNSPQDAVGGPGIPISPATTLPAAKNLATPRYTSPQSIEIDGALTQMNQSEGYPSAYVGPIASNLVTMSYTSPQAAELTGSTPEASGRQEAKKKRGGFLGRVKGAFK